ncbi:MAG: GntR family transcriptional regulator [Rubripirellula sp.]|nr:GntR family transcriptional regulator [Rubripirellula sp.]
MFLLHRDSISTLQALPRRKIRDQAAEQIKELISSKQLSPGDRLPTETEFADSFGVRRLSVRDATKTLKYLGIVEAETSVGLMAGQLDLRSVADRFGSARKLTTWIDLDIEFHRSPLEASDLAPLVVFGDLLHVLSQGFRDSVKKAQWQAGAESHRRIIDALRDGEITAATHELRKHIEDHKSRV